MALCHACFDEILMKYGKGFKSNDESSKRVSVTRAGHESARREKLGEVGEMLREHYCHMSECAAALDCALESISERLARPVLPCAAQRRALQMCYSSHTLQPLQCHRLVTELMECARKHALHEHHEGELMYNA